MSFANRNYQNFISNIIFRPLNTGGDLGDLTLQIKLRAGDKVSVRYYNWDGSSWIGGVYQSAFSGMLVYKL